MPVDLTVRNAVKTFQHWMGDRNSDKEWELSLTQFQTHELWGRDTVLEVRAFHRPAPTFSLSSFYFSIHPNSLSHLLKMPTIYVLCINHWSYKEGQESTPFNVSLNNLVRPCLRGKRRVKRELGCSSPDRRSLAWDTLRSWDPSSVLHAGKEKETTSYLHGAGYLQGRTT